MTDADLVAAARKGDSAAFGELVDRHRVAVYRAAMSVLGSHAEADEAAQDAFVMAFKRLASFRGDASFKTWLLTIAWNQAMNRRRNVARWLRRVVSMSGGDENADGSTPVNVASEERSPEQTTLDAELQRAIVKEIKGLTAKLKDALLLAQSGTYTYDEMAAITGTPAGTMKWRVSEARRQVKQRLQARGFNGV